MDSRDFHSIVYRPFDRTEADALMWRVLGWVSASVPIERVYPLAELDAWALRHGYEKRDGDALCDLLRQAQAFIVRDTPLSLAINDALAARRPIVNEAT